MDPTLTVAACALWFMAGYLLGRFQHLLPWFL